MKLSSYPLFELLLSQQILALSGRRMLYLLVFTSWNPNRCGVVQPPNNRADFVKKRFCAEQSHVFFYSSSKLLDNPKWGGIELLSPTRADIVTRRSCAEQLLVFESPRQYFLRLPTGVDLGSYPLIELLMSQEAPAQSNRIFFVSSSELFGSPKWGGVGQLSPIRTGIVTRSYCVAQSQVVIIPRQYFMSPQRGWSWIAIKSC